MAEKKLTVEETKQWVVKSMTVWGAVIVTLTGILPAINALFPGFDISPDWIASLDGGVKALISLVGMVVSVVLIMVDRLSGKEVKKTLVWREKDAE
jgi:uncharacterized membrane protein